MTDDKEIERLRFELDYIQAFRGIEFENLVDAIRTEKKTVEKLRADLDAANAKVERLESEHQNCGIAIVMLSRALLEAMACADKETTRDRWAAVLKKWGVPE